MVRLQRGTFEGLLAKRLRPGLEMGAAPAREPYGVIWPNGEFSLSWQQRATEQVKDNDEYRYLDERGGHGWPHCLLPFNAECAKPLWVLWALAQSTLPCLCGEIHTRPRTTAAYGSAGLTRYGARMVRSGAAVLQEEYSRHYLTFCTVTLPSMGMDQRRQVHRAWGKMVNRLVQRISRWLRRQGIATKIVGCSEIQGKRLSRTGEAYLHLHLLWPNKYRGRGRWAVDIDALRQWWCEELKRNGWSGQGSQPRIETKTVEKSAEGYLGKYMSKSSSEVSEFVKDVGEDCLPGQWWFISKDLRDCVHRATHRGFSTGELLQCLVDSMFDGYIGEFPGWLAEVKVPLYNSGIVRRVAWVGKLARCAHGDLTGMLKSA